MLSTGVLKSFILGENAVDVVANVHVESSLELLCVKVLKRCCPKFAELSPYISKVLVKLMCRKYFWLL